MQRRQGLRKYDFFRSFQSEWQLIFGQMGNGIIRNGILVREASTHEASVWDELVTGFDNYRIFHKTGWLRSIEEFSGAKPVYLIFENGGEIVGCLPGFLVKKALLRIFGSPLVGWQTESMGPAFDRERVSTGEMFAVLVPFLEKQYGVHHIEMTSHCLDGEAMKGLGFQTRRQSSCRVSLFPGDEDRMAKNIKSKTRNQLRKAIKLGLSVREETDESFVDEFYDQSKEVFTRNGVSLPFSYKRVLQLFRHMKAAGNLLALSVRLPEQETRIATGIFMIEGREMYLWSWTHRTQYGSFCPVELLMWTAMQRGIAAGCVSLDMGGVAAAKAKFGALPDETVHHWLRSRYSWLADLRDAAEKCYRWQQKVRGRMVRRAIPKHNERTAQAE